MDIDSLKENWEKSNAALERGRLSRETVDFNRKTTLQRIATRYKRMMWVSLAALWLFVLQFFRMYDNNPEIPFYYIIVYVAFFLVAASMDYWLFKGIKSINCTTMTVETVLKKVLFYRKRHLQFILVLFPGAMLMVYLFLDMFNFEKYVVYGACLGFMFGLAIGLKILWDFMSDYKQMLE